MQNYMRPKQKTVKKKYPPKYAFLKNFGYKALELIRISQILNNPDVIETLLCDIQTKYNIPLVTYQLGKAVRNKLLNYKETINSTFVDDKVVSILNTEICE